MDNRDDERVLMCECLEKTSHWDDLKDLDGPDLEAEIRSYWDACGGALCKVMNRDRSTQQNAVAKKWMELQKNGVQDITAAQLLRVALRKPKYLLLLPEDTDDPGVNQKNREANMENVKYRARFKILITELVPCCIHSKGWTPALQAKHRISAYRNDNDEDLVPAAAEAMVIAFVENNQAKWQWQMGVTKEHKNVTEYKEMLKKKVEKGEQLEPHEKEPKALYSKSTCGANPHGGWEAKGKLRFKDTEKMIIDVSKALYDVTS